ncbi:DUF2442 domain-containing protein, partial [candidate division KSB1 bacterium]|nr:DUF2442 domain-containing protein [candidate division KSB1 bacterium]
SYFRQVKVLHGTVSWPHDQDICPDTLYLDSQKEMPNDKIQPTQETRG